MFHIPGPGDATPLNSKITKNEKIEQNETTRESNSESIETNSERPSPANPLADPASSVRHPGNPRSRTASPRARTRRALGAEGETRAASFLLRRGYRIDARNVRYDGVEIDLIARRGAVVAFVEVKTRSSDRYGAPELAVDRRKQKRMIRAARAWRVQHPSFACRIRFDVVSVLVERVNGRDRWRIRHLVAAFDAGD